MKNKIIRNRGSIQKIEEIPKELRDLYKTSWDLKKKSLINMASDRAKFIDQTQSMNLFIENPTIRKLSSMYFYFYTIYCITNLSFFRKSLCLLLP